MLRGHAVVRALARTFGLNQAHSLVPRADCAYLSLDMAKVPTRYFLSAVQLQIQQLGLFRKPGFAFRRYGAIVFIWCWEEDLSPSDSHAFGKNPMPEALLRSATPGDGLALVCCTRGFEAQWNVGGELQRSRWFKEIPTESEWREFCRDAGQSEAPMRLFTPAVSAQAQKGWTLQTSLSTNWSRKQWLLYGCAIALSCVFVALFTAWCKLDYVLSNEREALRVLKTKYAKLLVTQQEIDKTSAFIAALYAQQPAFSQQQLIEDLRVARVVGKENGAVLKSWKYQNGQVIMGFGLIDPTLTPSVFLARFDRLKAFTRIRLPPQTSPGELVVQAEVVGNARGEAKQPTNQGMSGGDKP